jgi:hypothetical protein
VGQQFESGIICQLFDVAARTGKEIIDTKHLMALVQQLFAEMGAYEAGPARDQHALSRQPALCTLFHATVLGVR